MSFIQTKLVKMARGILLLTVFPLAWALPENPWSNGWSVCFFRTFTGLPCPFCGLTHAFVYAMHGQWSQASQYHPLWWMAALIVFLAGVASLVDATAGTTWLERSVRPLRTHAWSAGVILVAATLLRASFFPLPR